jgi:hypothetical protein
VEQEPDYDEHSSPRRAIEALGQAETKFSQARQSPPKNYQRKRLDFPWKSFAESRLFNGLR